jgi:hypothetical protein
MLAVWGTRRSTTLLPWRSLPISSRETVISLRQLDEGVQTMMEAMSVGLVGLFVLLLLGMDSDAPR